MNKAQRVWQREREREGANEGEKTRGTNTHTLLEAFTLAQYILQSIEFFYVSSCHIRMWFICTYRLHYIVRDGIDAMEHRAIEHRLYTDSLSEIWKLESKTNLSCIFPSLVFDVIPYTGKLLVLFLCTMLSTKWILLKFWYWAEWHNCRFGFWPDKVLHQSQCHFNKRSKVMTIARWR